jgi:nitroreductase
MEFADAVRRRRMVRSYEPDRPVPRDLVDGLLRLAIRAPSAGHTQGWRFLVLDDAPRREAFWAATSDGATDQWSARMHQAPVLIVCLSDETAYLDRYAEPDKGWTDRDTGRWPVPYWHVDVGMAAMILLLGATDLGLGACFFGVPTEHWDALRSAFAVPGRLTPVGVVSLGYPAPDLRSPSLRRGRRELSEVVAYGRFDSDSPDSS